MTVLAADTLEYQSELRGHTEAVTSLAFDAAGTLWSGGWDKVARSYALASNRPDNSFVYLTTISDRQISYPAFVAVDGKGAGVLSESLLRRSCRVEGTSSTAWRGLSEVRVAVPLRRCAPWPRRLPSAAVHFAPARQNP